MLRGECIDTSSSAGQNRLREKVLTGSADQSEVRRWQDATNQRHAPQKHASIGVENLNFISERVIAADARDTLAMKSGVVATGAAEWAQSAGDSIKEQRSVAELWANIGDIATTHSALLPGALARSKQEIQTKPPQKVVPRAGIIKVGGDHRNEAGRGTSLNPGWSDKYGGLPVWAILENQPERFEYLGHIFRNESALQVVSSALPVKGLLTPPGSWEIERGAAGAFSVLKPGGIVRMNFWIDMNNLPLVQRVITAFRVVGFEDVRFLSSNAGSVLWAIKPRPKE